ncbi:trichoplein keratin filament-binding protein isoform X1 [Dendroctonus ponderosae]|nr:trichoplein keratin filament-binding protein isoform X1 [Dendroctonus ponderosae]XP_048521519.1 trichoplein keratin filament-binding protein isoform X1 [Dendroctonus ponderosae]KAH1018302.1 hypothetical protein HUJ05_006102 [Dendroctonus ponderosae]
MMFRSESPPKERGRGKAHLESNLIRRRERDFKHQQMWIGAQDYYRKWDKVNSKFDQWTSPRYYADNNKMLSDLRHKRDKEELLVKRRDALRKLFDEENRSFQIELTVTKSLHKPRVKEVSTETLRDLNCEMKQRAEERRKREAEIKLYHQWRTNNPLIRQFESKYKLKDLKLSWLDQQIEKRMQKEAEEKECTRLIKEQQESRRRAKEKEAELNQQSEEKKSRLKECLDKQVEDLKQKQKISDELRDKEAAELKRKNELWELQEATKLEHQRRRARETALFNIKQHKLKLKQKAQDVLEALGHDQELILRMKRLELEHLMEDEKKRIEIRRDLEEFLSIVRQQQDLEKQRQKQFDFLFDSEAKIIHDKQMQKWNSEEFARKNLLKSVLDALNKQVEDKLAITKQVQREVLQEREDMLVKVEQYHSDLQLLKEEDAKRKQERRRDIEEDIKEKNAHKKQKENAKMKQIDEQLQRVRQEEDRLCEEIMKIQGKSNGGRTKEGRHFC